MKCVKTELKHAEKTKLRLLGLNILNKDYNVVRDNNYVYFPITKPIKGFTIMNMKLDKKNNNNLEELLRNKLTKKEFPLLKKSYDILGSIAILEIDKNLLNKRKIIAQSLLKTNKNIKTVVRKIGGHEGKYRIQKYEFLAGVNNLEITYKENNCLFKLDISKVYFSPRSANERLRIAKLVKPNESVLVMFSGISPYEINITKHSKAKEIYGIEINKEASKYAKINVDLNKIKRIKLFNGDVRNVLGKMNKKFDRILMPLPSESHKYLDLALKSIKNKGIIHYYCFSKEEAVKNILDFIKNKSKVKILRSIKCGQQSPRVNRYCVDFMVYNRKL